MNSKKDVDKIVGKGCKDRLTILEENQLNLSKSYLSLSGKYKSLQDRVAMLERLTKQ